MNANRQPDQYDAMVIAWLASEGLGELPWASMSNEQRCGALLLYEKLMSRAEPLLPRTEQMQYIHDSIARVREIRQAIVAFNEEARYARH